MPYQITTAELAILIKNKIHVLDSEARSNFPTRQLRERLVEVTILMDAFDELVDKNHREVVAGA